MRTDIYVCPCCGAPLAWNDGKLSCESCGNSFDAEQIEEMNRPSESKIVFKQEGAGYSQSDMAGMSAYTCKNCGAELVTDATTTATECPYCGTPTILPAQLESGVKPEFVLPFRITKEQAQQTFKNYFQGKRLLPNVFLNSRNHIMEIKKLYVPYWLFDCAADASISYEAEKVHTHRQGDWEIKTTEHYLLRRAGSMAFNSIPVDGSVKMDDKISESLEPYKLDDLISFRPAVLAGALADQADVDMETCEQRAVERVEKSMVDTFRQTVSEYTNVKVRNQLIRSRDGVGTPVLLPVWMISTEKTEDGKKKVYTFAINGQTGELACDVQPDKKKSRKWFMGVFAGAFAAGYAILVALSMMGVIA